DGAARRSLVQRGDPDRRVATLPSTESRGNFHALRERRRSRPRPRAPAARALPRSPALLRAPLAAAAAAPRGELRRDRPVAGEPPRPRASRNPLLRRPAGRGGAGGHPRAAGALVGD